MIQNQFRLKFNILTSLLAFLVFIREKYYLSHYISALNRLIRHIEIQFAACKRNTWLRYLSSRPFYAGNKRTFFYSVLTSGPGVADPNEVDRIRIQPSRKNRPRPSIKNIPNPDPTKSTRSGSTTLLTAFNPDRRFLRLRFRIRQNQPDPDPQPCLPH